MPARRVNASHEVRIVTRRPRLPASLRRDVRRIALHSCLICGRPGSPFHFHHYPPWHIVRTHSPDGVFLLCPNCHAEEHQSIAREPCAQRRLEEIVMNLRTEVRNRLKDGNLITDVRSEAGKTLGQSHLVLPRRLCQEALRGFWVLIEDITPHATGAESLSKLQQAQDLFELASFSWLQAGQCSAVAEAAWALISLLRQNPNRPGDGYLLLRYASALAQGGVSPDGAPSTPYEALNPEGILRFTHGDQQISMIAVGDVSTYLRLERRFTDAEGAAQMFHEQLHHYPAREYSHHQSNALRGLALATATTPLDLLHLVDAERARLDAAAPEKRFYRPLGGCMLACAAASADAQKPHDSYRLLLDAHKVFSSLGDAAEAAGTAVALKDFCLHVGLDRDAEHWQRQAIGWSHTVENRKLRKRIFDPAALNARPRVLSFDWLAPNLSGQKSLDRWGRSWIVE